MKKAALTVALALAVSTLKTFAQDAGGPLPAGGGAGGPGRGGVHLLPPRALEQLNLTDDQKKQLADLETEVKEKLAKILTPEQLQQLKQMRPQPRQGGGNGPGPGGNGPGPGGGEGQPEAQRPPSE